MAFNLPFGIVGGVEGWPRSRGKEGRWMGGMQGCELFGSLWLSSTYEMLKGAGQSIVSQSKASFCLYRHSPSTMLIFTSTRAFQTNSMVNVLESPHPKMPKIVYNMSLLNGFNTRPQHLSFTTMNSATPRICCPT